MTFKLNKRTPVYFQKKACLKKEQQNVIYKTSNETPLHTCWSIQTPEHGQHQMLTERRSNRNSRLSPVGMGNGAATLKNRLAVSLKTLKHTLIIWSSNNAPWYLPKGTENLRPHKTMFTAALFTTAQQGGLSAGDWTNGGPSRWWTAIRCWAEMSVQPEKTWRKLKCILLREKSQSRRLYTHCMIPTPWYFGRGKTTETVTNRWLPGFEDVGRDQQSNLRAVKILCMIL